MIQFVEIFRLEARQGFYLPNWLACATLRRDGYGCAYDNALPGYFTLSGKFV